MSKYSTAGVTIRELRRWLDDAEARGLTPDTVVILAKDSEGNGYSPLADRDEEGVYFPESSYAGEVRTWDEDDVDDFGSGRYTHAYWRECALADGGMPCLVLWPTN